MYTGLRDLSLRQSYGSVGGGGGGGGGATIMDFNGLTELQNYPTNQYPEITITNGSLFGYAHTTGGASGPYPTGASASCIILAPSGGYSELTFTNTFGSLSFWAQIPSAGSQFYILDSSNTVIASDTISSPGAPTWMLLNYPGLTNGKKLQAFGSAVAYDLITFS